MCECLRSVELPEGLEKIGLGVFNASGLESVEFPASLRTIAQAAFTKCKNLRTVKFNEGLEVLGANEYRYDGSEWFGVFEESALERVELSTTLKRIEYNVFGNCKNLKNIKLPNSLEYIGKQCFWKSGLQAI